MEQNVGVLLQREATLGQMSVDGCHDMVQCTSQLTKFLYLRYKLVCVQLQLSYLGSQHIMEGAWASVHRMTAGAWYTAARWNENRYATVCIRVHDATRQVVNRGLDRSHVRPWVCLRGYFISPSIAELSVTLCCMLLLRCLTGQALHGCCKVWHLRLGLCFGLAASAQRRFAWFCLRHGDANPACQAKKKEHVLL